MKLFYFLVIPILSVDLYAQTVTTTPPKLCGGECITEAEEALGIEGAVGGSSYGEHEKIIALMDKSYKKDDLQKDISTVFACAGANTSGEKCGGVIDKASKVFEYAAYLKETQDMNTKQYDAIKNFSENKYARGLNDVGAEKTLKKVLGEYKDLAKAQADLANYENAEKRSVLLPDQEKQLLGTSKQDLEGKVQVAQKELCSSLLDVQNIPASESGEFMEALEDAKEALNPSIVDVSSTDIYSSFPELERCADPKEKDDKTIEFCKKMAGKYLASVVSGNQPWTLIRTSDENCDFIDNMGDVLKVSSAFYGMTQSLKFQECGDAYGLDDPKCIKMGVNIKRFGGDPYGLTAPYYDTTSEESLANYKVTPHFITAATGAPTSLSIDGTYPVNSFSSNTNQVTDPTATGLGVTAGANGSINSGTASNLLNNMSKQYNAMGTGASSFNNRYSNYSTQIGNYNNNLSAAVNSAVDPKVYTDRATSVQKVLDKAAGSGPRYSGQQGYTTTIDLRQKITELNAKKSELVVALSSGMAKGASSMYDKQWGSLSEKRRAIVYLATAPMSFEYTRAQIAAIDSEISLYYRNTKRYMNSNPNLGQNVLDISYMYASNDKAIYGKKALKLKTLNTPVKEQFVLKDGWQNEFKKYIADMMKKAEESKKKMNLAKTRLQQLLAQKMDIVPVAKLPNPNRLAYEINNMQSIEAAARRNMINIEKAMQYHRSRKLNTPANIYAQYEKESTELKTSMQNVVSAIDNSKGSIDKSYVVLNSLQAEIPRSEALRKVAKQMVEQGL
jgi:hypothetical protein